MFVILAVWLSEKSLSKTVWQNVHETNRRVDTEAYDTKNVTESSIGTAVSYQIAKVVGDALLI